MLGARLRTAGVLAIALVAAGGALGGCGGTADPAESAAGSAAAARRSEPKPGTLPIGVEFVQVWENERGAPYFPLDGLAAVAWALDGTLILGDDKRGRVFGYDPREALWYEFEQPRNRPFLPVDVRVDGFKVLVLDTGSRLLYRYELGGALQDRLINFRTADPAYDTLPTAFDIDQDGRLVVTDAIEQQVLIFDPFLEPSQRVGSPGSHAEQFDDPSGVVFTRDGSFVVTDRGNGRLQRFNRLGFFEALYGGRFVPDNPFRAPSGIDADAYGNLFVADGPAGAVHVLDPGGELLFNAGGDLPLVATFTTPVDVAVGPDGMLAVADRARPAVLIFRILYE
jgi:sugar lactone lactonase YvrE